MRKLIKFINGKKTIIASLYWGFVMPSLVIMYPEGIPGDLNKWVVILGVFLTSTGLGHKWYKKSAGVVVLLIAVGSIGCSKNATIVDSVVDPIAQKAEEYTPVPEKRYPVEFGRTGTGILFAEPITVYFDFDSDVMSKDWKERLDGWTIDNKGLAVVVMGGCCPIGTNDYNNALGLRRARTVADYLEKRGIIVSDVQSWGETALVSENPTKYRFNRRSEVRSK